MKRLALQECKDISPKATDESYFAPEPKLYWALIVTVLVGAAYITVVPRQFRISEQWEEPVVAALAGASMALFVVRSWVRKKLSFWIALAVSVTIQVLICHWFLQHYPPHSRGAGKLIWFLCIGIGYVVGGLIFLAFQKLGSYDERLS